MNGNGNDLVLDIMNSVSDVIKKAEMKMEAKPFCFPAEFDCLKWEKHGKKMRITYEGYPLISTSFEIRSAHFEKLPKLIEAARQAQLDKIGTIDLNSISDLNDLIDDL